MSNFTLTFFCRTENIPLFTINYFNKMLLEAYLVPSTVLDAGKHGAYIPYEGGRQQIRK